jgi:hypothetical protein
MRILNSQICCLFCCIVLILFGLKDGFGQPIGTATDYEWELKTPGRTLFRDRTPIGQIALVKTEGRGIFGGKGKASGEMLTILSDVSFIPGDTLRFFGAAIEFDLQKRISGSIMLDTDELPLLWKSASYIGKTAANIANTERLDTSIRFRGKGDWNLEFTQKGQDQFLGISWSDPVTGIREQRSLTPDQLTILVDLIDLTIFELNRQGAGIVLDKEK